MCVQVLVLKQQEQQERHELELMLASMADKAHDDRARDGAVQSKGEKERKVPGGGGSPRRRGGVDRTR